uniref:Uncharacterized protein n=1 Tax=Zea mays TaxID=4577 RepID=A0A804LEM6_MAIZE
MPQGYTVATTCPRPQKGAFAARVLSKRRHRWTGRFEAHLWDKHCLAALHNKKKGRQESWSLPYLDAFGAAKNMHVYEVSFIDS